MLLRIQTYDEGGNVDHLLSDPNVSLPDEHTSVVNALGQPALEHLCLQASLQEVFDFKRKHVVKTHPIFIQHPDADETSDERVPFEQPLGIFRIELEELTRRTTNFRERQRDAPNFTLVAQAILAGKLKLGVEAWSLVRPSGYLIGFSMIPWGPGHLEEERV